MKSFHIVRQDKLGVAWTPYSKTETEVRMKTSPQLTGTASGLSDSFHHQLNMYALVASAAGVGLLALTPSAEAKIVYTRAHQSIVPNHTIPLDLNHDGIADFRFKDIHSTTSPYGFSHIGNLSVLPARQANEIRGYSKFSRHYASALQAGVSIGPKGPFAPGAAVMATVYNDSGAHRNISSVCNGPWSTAVNRYLGFKFLIHGKVHFGWARLSVTCPGTDVDATLTGYAYETIPDKAIITGRKNGEDATVQPASLGHLARGKSAIPALRLRQTAATTQ
jgi:hypothetical protein